MQICCGRFLARVRDAPRAKGSAMKSFSSAGAAGLIALGVPSTAVAQGITYDCDTAANHYSELVLPTVDGPFTVSGTVQLNALAGSTTYAPIARIQIASSTAPGQSPSAFAGFSLSALPVDAKKTPSGAPAVQMLSYNSAGKEDELLPLSVVTKPGTVQPFKLSYDGSSVSVSLGNDAKTFPLKATGPVVRVVCSTGEFLITNLTIRSSR
jgi:hypothetical protein